MMSVTVTGLALPGPPGLVVLAIRFQIADSCGDGEDSTSAPLSSKKDFQKNIISTGYISLDSTFNKEKNLNCLRSHFSDFSLSSLTSGSSEEEVTASSMASTKNAATSSLSGIFALTKITNPDPGVKIPHKRKKEIHKYSFSKYFDIYFQRRPLKF
jgi:hypothetical protein